MIYQETVFTNQTLDSFNPCDMTLYSFLSKRKFLKLLNLTSRHWKVYSKNKSQNIVFKTTKWILKNTVVLIS